MSVRYVTSDGTAKAGDDYTATSGTLRWSAGDSAVKTFFVPLLKDRLAEPNEIVNITLSNPTGGATLGEQNPSELMVLEPHHDDHIWLHVDGRYIKNSRNEIFMGCGFEIAWGAENRKFLQRDLIPWIKAHGFNVVRLSMMNFSDVSKLVDPDLSKLDEAIAACRANQLYVYINPFVDWIPEKDRPAYLKILRRIVKRYIGEPWVLGYETMNEPWGKRDLNYMTAQMVRDSTIATIQMIRSIDRRHIILIPSVDWSHLQGMAPTWGHYLDTVGNPDTLNPPQIVWTHHDYPPAETTAHLEQMIKSFKEAHNVPLYHTETGCIPGEWDDAMTLEGYRQRLREYFNMQVKYGDGWSIMAHNADCGPEHSLFPKKCEDVLIPIAARDATWVVDDGVASQVKLALEPEYGVPSWGNPGMTADGAAGIGNRRKDLRRQRNARPVGHWLRVLHDCWPGEDRGPGDGQCGTWNRPVEGPEHNDTGQRFSNGAVSRAAHGDACVRYGEAMVAVRSADPRRQVDRR